MNTEQSLQELLQKYSEGRCTAAEEQQLQEWFVRIGQGSPVSGLSGEDRQRMLHTFAHSPRFAAQQKPALLHYLKRGIAAAAILAGIILFSWLLLVRQHTPVFVQLHTGSGEMKRIVLPDRSVVWLNAQTELAYHPDFATHREIRLSGEALFEVTGDEKHPFTVLTADSLQTTVLGTQFNIRNYNRVQETQITVLSGRVQVAQPQHHQVMGILGSNQVIRFNRAKNSYSQTTENAAALTGWRQGVWALKNQGIEELSLLLHNQYGITLVNHRKELATLLLNANFTKQQDAREIVAVFSMLAGCRQRWKDQLTVEIY
jgi:ferric-dicitrate binding protein FerR (iron transport regulator)